MEQFLKVGIITSTHGIRGDVKVYPTTDSPDRFLSVEQVWLKPAGKEEKTLLEIAQVRFQKNMVLLRFRGFDSINDVEQFRGAELYVDREHAAPLGENEYYIADLLGMQVYTDEDEMLGTLKDVLETGANDVYIVDTPKGELMIPAIRQCILHVDVEQGRMTVHLLPGLEDL